MTAGLIFRGTLLASSETIAPDKVPGLSHVQELEIPMTRDTILEIASQAVGSPASGPVHDALPAIADAIAQALDPKPGKAKAPAAAQ